MKNIKRKILNIKKDSRGFFVEILRLEDLKLKNKQFGQVSISTAKPGQTKGEHYHLRKTEWFCVIKGKGLLKLIDMKSGETEKIKMSENNMVTVQIPPNVWHAISNTGKNDMYLLAYISEPYNPKDPDTFNRGINYVPN